MKRPVMRDLYAVAVTFLGPHCVNGGADIWLRASLVRKATAVAPSVHHQRKPALAKSL
ncbi:putative bfpM [Escherichia coli P0299438.8]|nr:bfpM [Escherichia coli B7A]ENB92623.1 putative bfpM [Escherichia coli P0299438.11]ENB95779.1 putative bfpM [Escherichia coli P0299438.3]ENC11666.1 putative bfpM [Escherichia coli P0299438.6]ENC13052.1 putative bfpM [Escherichia coli P0299438.7]ENC21433.1 putative bfpM [Escherichia coli P0299438.8]